MMKPPRITVVTCPKCQCDVFTLTKDHAWGCINCKQLAKGPKNFHVLHKKGNPYWLRPLISLVTNGATYETKSAKPALV